LIFAAGDSEIRPSFPEPAVTLASGSGPRLASLQRLPTLIFCLMQQTPLCVQTRTHPQPLFFRLPLVTCHVLPPRPSAISFQPSSFIIHNSHFSLSTPSSCSSHSAFSRQLSVVSGQSIQNPKSKIPSALSRQLSAFSIHNFPLGGIPKGGT
jgi:hypothetical protein